LICFLMAGETLKLRPVYSIFIPVPPQWVELNAWVALGLG
jgi:hypothetical protein